jgi:hypothetical protein
MRDSSVTASGESKNGYRYADERADGVTGNGGARQRENETYTNGMSDDRVRVGSHQFVIPLDRNRATPVPANHETRPERNCEATQRLARAQDSQWPENAARFASQE